MDLKKIFATHEDITRESVEAYLIEAAQTDRGLSDREYSWLYKSNVSWPLIQKDQGQEFANAVANGGKWENEPVFYMPPTRAALGRYEMIMNWLKMIQGKNCVRDRRIVFFGAKSKMVKDSQQLNIGFVQHYTGCHLHRVTVNNLYNKGLDIIAGGLAVRL